MFVGERFARACNICVVLISTRTSMYDPHVYMRNCKVDGSLRKDFLCNAVVAVWGQGSKLVAHSSDLGREYSSAGVGLHVKGGAHAELEKGCR